MSKMERETNQHIASLLTAAMNYAQAEQVRIKCLEKYEYAMKHGDTEDIMNTGNDLRRANNESEKAQGSLEYHALNYGAAHLSEVKEKDGGEDNTGEQKVVGE